MASNRHGDWDGGYTRKDSRGRTIYVIRHSIGGNRYEVSTRCTSSAAAEKEFKRFQLDPANYAPRGGGVVVGAIRLDAALSEEFLTWSRDVKKNGSRWVGMQRLALAWWAKHLGSKDLRAIDLAADLLPVLEGAPGLRVKIEVLKRLYSWLVGVVHRIEPAQDPTYRKLKVPQAEPEQWTRTKASPRSAYEAVRKQLGDTHWRDALDVLAGTGWHLSELVRFAQTGRVEKHPTAVDTWILECPLTKGGEVLRTAVGKRVSTAGRRLRKRGTLDERRFYDALRKCRPYTPPGTYRHSVATWAISAGADPAAVAAFLGHKSPRTTKKFYATHSVPVRVPTLA